MGEEGRDPQQLGVGLRDLRTSERGCSRLRPLPGPQASLLPAPLTAALTVGNTTSDTITALTAGAQCLVIQN